MITNQYSNVYLVACLKYSVRLLSASAGIEQWLLHNNGCSLHTFEKLCGYMKYLTLE